MPDRKLSEKDIEKITAKVTDKVIAALGTVIEPHGGYSCEAEVFDCRKKYDCIAPHECQNKYNP